MTVLYFRKCYWMSHVPDSSRSTRYGGFTHGCHSIHTSIGEFKENSNFVWRDLLIRFLLIPDHVLTALCTSCYPTVDNVIPGSPIKTIFVNFVNNPLKSPTVVQRNLKKLKSTSRQPSCSNFKSLSGTDPYWTMLNELKSFITLIDIVPRLSSRQWTLSFMAHLIRLNV